MAEVKLHWPHLWLSASVFPLVDTHYTRANAGVVTPGALEVIHTIICLHVCFEGVWTAKWVVTLLTYKWLLSTVDKVV